MELKRVAERLITLAKRKDHHAMRLAFAFLRDKEVVRNSLPISETGISAINGGYTRVFKIGKRKGDAAPMAIIELTQRKEKEEKKEKAKETKETKKETKVKKEAKEPKAKKETKAVKEPKVKKEAKAETKEPKEKKPRKKKETAASEEVK